MQSLLYMYAMTGYLHFNHSTTRGKIPNLDIDPADDEELPETCRYTDVDGILHDPYSEVGLIREQLVGVGAIEEVISKSPFLIELEVDVSDCGNKDRFDLKLPEIRKLVLRKKQPSGPQSEITVENCHNLHTLEIFEANVPHQLERLVAFFIMSVVLVTVKIGQCFHRRECRSRSAEGTQKQAKPTEGQSPCPFHPWASSLGGMGLEIVPGWVLNLFYLCLLILLSR